MSVMELQHAYNRITTVWNLGTDEQRVLAGQLMDDIVKVMKFSKRYKPDNFARKSEELINAAKKLFEAYAAYRRGENESEIIKLIDAPENKQEMTQSISRTKKEPKIKEGQVTLSLRGGKREGAGRKAIGVTRKVSITLSEEIWASIDEQIAADPNIKNLAHYFRLSVGGDG